MDCPPGKVYWAPLKKCISVDALPGVKGKSMSPCPQGKVWQNATRKCVLEEIYKKHYGTNKFKAAKAKQEHILNLRMKTRKAKSPPRPRAKTPNAVREKAPHKPRSISPVRRNPFFAAAFSSPSNKFVSKLDTEEPRKDSFMPRAMKLKKSMLSWISEKCNNKEDVISQESFDEATTEELKTIVRLGNNFCYKAADLDQHIKSSIERDLPLKNISEPWYRIDSKDLGTIEHQNKLFDNSYELPVRTGEMPSDNYGLFIDSVDKSGFKYVFLFDKRKLKAVDGIYNYSPAIPVGGWLGYIPEKGTDTLVSLIKKAFHSGTIFTKATNPFRCCRFHLKKTKEFWADNTERKIKAMEDEIRGII